MYLYSNFYCTANRKLEIRSRSGCVHHPDRLTQRQRCFDGNDADGVRLQVRLRQDRYWRASVPALFQTGRSCYCGSLLAVCGFRD